LLKNKKIRKIIGENSSINLINNNVIFCSKNLYDKFSPNKSLVKLLENPIYLWN